MATAPLPAVVAETLSGTAGVVRTAVDAGTTRSIGECLVIEADIFAADGLAWQLVADGGDGDLLHVWLDVHFNVYELLDLGWRIYGKTAPMPASRLSGSLGTGQMLTRRAPGSTILLHYGSVPEQDVVEISVGSGAWRLTACTCSVAVGLSELPWTGAADGDQIRTWDVGAQAWMLFTRAGGMWKGMGVDSVMLLPGTPLSSMSCRRWPWDQEQWRRGSGIFLEFDSVTIDASPANGYEFHRVEWERSGRPSTYESVGCRNGQRA